MPFRRCKEKKRKAPLAKKRGYKIVPENYITLFGFFQELARIYRFLKGTADALLSKETVAEVVICNHF